MSQYYNLPDEFADQEIKKKITKSILENPNTVNESADRRAFLQAAALEFSGEVEQAWKCAQKANNLILKDHENDIKTELNEINTRTDWLKKNIGSINTKSCVEKEFPVTLFIFGPSRSGKTTLEGLVCQNADITRGYENPVLRSAILTAYHESGFFPVNTLAYLPPQIYPNVTKLYKKNIDTIGTSFKAITNTTPGYLWDAPFLHRVVPNCRYVFVKRDVNDLMWRIYTKNYRSGNWYSYDLVKLKEYIERYYEIIDLMATSMPTITTVINYEDLVANPSEACTNVLKLCGVASNGLDYGVVQSDVGCSIPYRALIAAKISGGHV